MFRQLAGILLLTCLVAPFVATYSWLQYEKKLVRKTVKCQLIKGVKEHELVLLKFSKIAATTQIHWEHAREFEFDGEMYDVVSCDTIGDTLLYHCWPDHAETALNKQLNQLVAGALEHDQDHHQSQQKWVGFYLALFHAPIVPWHLTTPAPEYRRNVFCDSSFQTADAPLPLSPPPDFC